MKIFRATLLACLLLSLCFLPGLPLAEAASDARWSIAIKGGLFAPSLADWERQNGSSQDTLLALALGFKLTPRLEIGLEGASFSAEGKATTTSARVSGVDQNFKLFPAQAYLVYHFIFDKDQAFVPYFGGGYSRFSYQGKVEGGAKVSGAQEGSHFRGGLSLLLDALDPRTAARAQDWGLINSYLFIETQYAEVDDFGDAAIDLGGWTYFTGLRYEF